MATQASGVHRVHSEGRTGDNEERRERSSEWSARERRGRCTGWQVQAGRRNGAPELPDEPKPDPKKFFPKERPDFLRGSTLKESAPSVCCRLSE